MTASEFMAWLDTKGLRLMQCREDTKEIIRDPCSYYRCKDGFTTNSYDESVECPDCRGRGYAREREITVKGWVELDEETQKGLLAEFFSLEKERL